MVKRQGFGFSHSSDEGFSDWQGMAKNIDEEVRRAFRPEFLNRIDEQILFSPLSKDEMLKIVDLMVREVGDRLMGKGIKLQLSQSGRKLILEKGYQPQYGARPLRRTIQRMLEDPLSDMILDGRLVKGSSARVAVVNGAFSFRCHSASDDALNVNEI